MLFQSTEVTGWSRTLVDSRSAYTSLREHLLRYIENPDEVGSALDPLDDDQYVSNRVASLLALARDEVARQIAETFSPHGIPCGRTKKFGKRFSKMLKGVCQKSLIFEAQKLR